MSRKNKRYVEEQDKAAMKRNQGITAVEQHPIFGPLAHHVHFISDGLCHGDGWAIVTSNGEIHVNVTKRGEPEEWTYVFAHCLLHLGFGHFKVQKYQQQEWNAACDCYIAKFLYDLKLKSPPLELKGLLQDLAASGSFSLRSEEALFEQFCEQGIPAVLLPTGTAGHYTTDMLMKPQNEMHWGQKVDWQDYFARGLALAVSRAVDIAGGVTPPPGSPADAKVLTEAEKARRWFISNYPLLGALATSFTLIEDPLICHRQQISIAAVNVEAREIYINPHAGLNAEELRFVMAHELLHVGLRHDARCGGRDPYLWNVACDYVINGWLVEMGVGDLPRLGALHDPALKGESAEAIYDLIVTDLRHFRKLATFRGVEMGDIVCSPGWWATGEGRDLDEFYRQCLSQGLLMHEEQQRGYLASGLIEEIRALSQPPIPWDVELAQWFDLYFRPRERVRTYARLSRRQSATPDIPRPQWIPELPDDNRTFGVLLDTSGSMVPELLAKALGAIASYSIARDVSAVRVIFCDAATYDQGYMAPEDIAGRVKVRGRGGTILQPGINLLEGTKDFPPDGPLLIITDGKCDSLRINRPHAFLLPEGCFLPFRARGPVFRMK